MSPMLVYANLLALQIDWIRTAFYILRGSLAIAEYEMRKMIPPRKKEFNRENAGSKKEKKSLLVTKQAKSGGTIAYLW